MAPVQKTFLILMLGMVTMGCQRSDRNSPVRRETPRVQEVSARHFELEYFAPRTPMNQWRYRGIVDGWHVLDYYGMGEGDQAQYYYSIRTQVYNLPKNFPAKPQPPVKTFLTKDDEQYINDIGRQILIDKQRRGETGGLE